MIEPIFEREFAPGSYGFRPGRGCKDALGEVEQYLKADYRYVVDADLKAYFDSIPHDRLLAEVRTRISDGRVLELIEMFVKQQILEDLKLWTPERGTPQGAVISPLLANLYLHSVDMAMAKSGYVMVRYADDFVILCRTQEEADKPLDGWIRRRLRSILRKRENRKGMSRGWDNMHWTNKFFLRHGLFSLAAAHDSLLQPLKR